MAFTDSQLRKLKEKIRPYHIKAREADGITLHYLEGWHVISEANRIFGFDGWDRETVASQCVWTKQMGSRFAAAYVIRIRINVRAGDIRIMREGSGAGEAVSATPGQAHEFALKAAETDATKRALSTFGNAFGLSLYGGAGEDLRRKALNGSQSAGSSDGQVSNSPSGTNNPIDKSVLALAEPKRLRNPDHLRRLSTLPCIICGRKPAHAHHLTFAQLRAMGSKTSDEYAVPLCALHHRDLHNHGNELEWWRLKNIDPLPLALSLWQGSHTRQTKTPEAQAETATPLSPDEASHIEEGTGGESTPHY
jgi:DNA recombination protein Rad52